MHSCPNLPKFTQYYLKQEYFAMFPWMKALLAPYQTEGRSLADSHKERHWNMRCGMDLKTPSASIQGPRVMLILSGPPILSG